MKTSTLLTVIVSFVLCGWDGVPAAAQSSAPSIPSLVPLPQLSAPASSRGAPFGNERRLPAAGMQPGTKIAQILGMIRNWYVDADSLDMLRMEEEAVKDVLLQLDPHSSYFTPDEARTMNEKMQGQFNGVGISTILLRDTAMVVSVLPNGPAARAGIRIGDRIVTVNMTPMTGAGLTPEHLQRALRGNQGTQVLIGIRRKGEPRLLPFYVVRNRIPIESIEAAYMVTREVGYIRIGQFAGTTYEELVKAIGRLQWQGMKRLMLDLCDNAGGLLDAAVKVSDVFLKEGRLILYTEGDRQKRTDYPATRNGLFEQGAMVVMINEGSASGSEVLAGAVQDWERGTVVGRRSFGKGLVQRQVSLQDGSMIRITVARFHTPSGRMIQKPYMETREAYNNEVFTRNLHPGNGSVPPAYDTLQVFQTLLTGRTVYGGGGIMPDVNVPVDTARIELKQYLHNNMLMRATALLIDMYYPSWRTKYQDSDSFAARMKVTPAMLDMVRKELGLDKQSADAAWFDRLKGQIATEIKWTLVRNIWGMEAFCKLRNESDAIFQTALHELEAMEPVRPVLIQQ